MGLGYQELVVSRNPAAIKVSKQTIIEADEVDKQLEKWTKLKQQMDDQQYQSGIKQSGGNEGSQDVEMIINKRDDKKRGHEISESSKITFFRGRPTITSPE